MRARHSVRVLLLVFGLVCGCQAATPVPVGSGPEALRRQFRDLVFESRKVTPIRASTILTTMAEGRRVERVRFETEPGQQAVAAIARPEKAEGRLPAVIVQH